MNETWIESGKEVVRRPSLKVSWKSTLQSFLLYVLFLCPTLASWQLDASTYKRKVPKISMWYQSKMLSPTWLWGTKNPVIDASALLKKKLSKKNTFSLQSDLTYNTFFKPLGVTFEQFQLFWNMSFDKNERWLQNISTWALLSKSRRWYFWALPTSVKFGRWKTWQNEHTVSWSVIPMFSFDRQFKILYTTAWYNFSHEWKKGVMYAVSSKLWHIFLHDSVEETVQRYVLLDSSGKMTWKNKNDEPKIEVWWRVPLRSLYIPSSWKIEKPQINWNVYVRWYFRNKK